jgi:serine/threonine protein kinase
MAQEGRSYHVQHVLGKGGFGTVYQAEMVSGGGFAKPVALKVLNEEMGAMAEVAQRLRDEARLLGRLKHPAILRVDDLVRLEGAWTVVMELLVGANLHQLVRAKGALPLGVALEVGHVVAGALHAAHDRPGPDGEPLRVLHRDIKPSNIQLTPLGEVKVLDFGVARASFANREAATRSLIFGSVGYMAPERMAGRDSHAGDVYALGVLLYEILSARRLGTACSRPSLQATLVDDALRELAELHPDEDLHALLRSALAFEPEARPRAEAFQRQARRLRARHPEPWMSDWTEANVPGVMESRKLTSGPLCGRVLRERDRAPASRDEPPQAAPSPPHGGNTFTPLPFEPSAPHEPTVGHDTPLADEIPSEPLGLPPLPKQRAPRRSGAPQQEPQQAQPSEPTPPPLLPATPTPSPAPGDSGPHTPTLAGPAIEPGDPPRTQFERLEPPEARPEASNTALHEASTSMFDEPVPGAASASTPASTRRRWPWLALAAAVTAGSLGLMMVLGDPDPLPTAPPAEPEAAPTEASPAPDEDEPPAPMQPDPAEPTPEPTPSPRATPRPPQQAAPTPDTRQGPRASDPPAEAPQEEQAQRPTAAPVASPWGARAEPTPEAPTTATVTLMGDASSVQLLGDAGSFAPGVIPAGHYRIQADFPGLDAPVQAGTLDLTPGQAVLLRCSSGFDRCVPEQAAGGE